MSDYDPKNWYWRVNSDQSKVYSSLVNDYVLSTNPEFQIWITNGNKPIEIDSEASLGEALASQFLRPVANGVLQAYLDKQINGVDKVQFKIMFYLYNQIRALNGQQPATVPQAIAAMRNLI